MKSLNISQARNNLPFLLDSVFKSKEEIVITRHGRPLARILPYRSFKGDAESTHPLRGKKITISDDFDAPMPEMWDALRK